MGFLAWIALGLIVGVVAKFLMPGDDPGGMIVTILIGVAGGLLGGFLGAQFGIGSVTGFDLPSFALAIGGALLLLFGWRIMKGRG
jgi:uncharacterized membrane protein YeaQ/YmgE (transglycosylase-associated protein family)